MAPVPSGGTRWHASPFITHPVRFNKTCSGTGTVSRSSFVANVVARKSALVIVATWTGCARLLNIAVDLGDKDVSLRLKQGPIDRPDCPRAAISRPLAEPWRRSAGRGRGQPRGSEDLLKYYCITSRRLSGSCRGCVLAAKLLTTRLI